MVSARVLKTLQPTETISTLLHREAGCPTSAATILEDPIRHLKTGCRPRLLKKLCRYHYPEPLVIF